MADLNTRLLEIFTPLEGAEVAGRIVGIIQKGIDGVYPAVTVRAAIDGLITKHSISGDDLAFLEQVKNMMGEE
jgi:hypothetical protein